MIIRIVTFNIQNGVGVTQGYHGYALVGWKYVLPHSPVALDGVAEMVEGEAVDVLALNECEGGSYRSRRINYARWLSERTALSHHVFFPTFRREWRGRTMSNQGNAVLSRTPIVKHRNHRLPGRGEPRSLGQASVQLSDRLLTIFTTHLSLDRRERMDQIEALAVLVDDVEGPRVITGDLNTADLEELRPIEEAGLRKLPTGPTFPCWEPRRSLDHVFVSDECPRATATVLERVRVADHLPVLTTVTI